MSRKPTAHEVVFDQWWGRYVIGLTDEEFAAGSAGRAVQRAAEAAWKASALALRQRPTTERHEPPE